MNYDDERLHGSMQLALGQFVFELGTLAYQDFKRSNDWRHASNSRVGARPAYQFVGVGDDAISLSGWVAPGQVGSYASIAALRAMGDSGQAFALVSGTGEVFGQYVIKQLEETGTFHDKRGRPGRVEFSLQLTRVDDNAGGEKVTVDDGGQYVTTEEE